jgi:epoxide hydrolase-like predicted phosphatase
MIKAIIFDCFGVVLDIMRGTRNEPLIELIQSLQPKYQMAMLSNVRGRRSLDDRFRDGELDTLFEVVVASGDIGFEKPDPEIYTMTAAKLGVAPEECLFVDDIPEFCVAAESVGMKSFRFVSSEQSLDQLILLISGFDKKG